VDTRWRKSPSGPPRKYYRLTLAGRQALEAKTLAWEEFSRAVQAILQEGRDGRSGS